MKVGIVVFPGSNCDHDAWFAVSQNLHHQAEFIWHEAASVGQIDAVILPGGFAFGDYLRCGAIAKFSPVMKGVKNFAQDGGLVLGICNGFQVLTESGLLPGALVRNANRQFVCRTVGLEIVSTNSPFTHQASKRQMISLPVAHGEGCYVADESTLDRLEAEDRIMLRYRDNPNGSMRNIAGIVNAARNVMGIMPHPERASDPLLGNTDGAVILDSMLASLATKTGVLALSGS
jgi:phosphoribosylformylglycinamidine synthase subunit PurQ / glutaminase